MKNKFNFKYFAIILGIAFIGCTNDKDNVKIPSEATNLNAVAGKEQVVLSWTKSTDDVKKYWITMDPLIKNTFSVDKDIETVTVDDLKGDTAYTFTLVAQNTSGFISDGISVTATPEVIDRTAPSEAGDFSAIPDDSKISLSWTKPSENDLASYELTYEPGSVSLPIDKSIESYILENLTNDTEYTFTLKSKDDSGNISAGVKVKATPKLGDNTPPAEATDFSFTGDFTNTQFTVNWVNPTDADFNEIELTYYYDSADPTTVSIPSTENMITIDATYEQNYVIVLKTKDKIGNFSTGVTKKIRFGNYSVGSQADVDAFDVENVAILAGKLKMKGTGVTNLSNFSNLERVEGKFDISGTGITNLDAFGRLNFIASRILITNNANLSDFCGLKNLINVGGDPSSYTVTGNASNPTKQEIIDNCK